MLRTQWNRIWSAALACGLFCGPALAAPVLRHLTVKVEMAGSTDYTKIAGSSAKSKQQHRQLSVTLDNRDPQQVTDVSVKWAIYARNMVSHQLVTVKQGTLKTRIDALSTTTVQSDKVSIKGTPKHSVVSSKKVKGKTQTGTRNQPAKGEEYYGYAVAVFAGTDLIDEVYSQPSLKLTEGPP